MSASKGPVRPVQFAEQENTLSNTKVLNQQQPSGPRELDQTRLIHSDQTRLKHCQNKTCQHFTHSLLLCPCAPTSAFEPHTRIRITGFLTSALSLFLHADVRQPVRPSAPYRSRSAPLFAGPAHSRPREIAADASPGYQDAAFIFSSLISRLFPAG